MKKYRYIGVNFIDGWLKGGIASSFNEIFQDEKVLIGDGVFDKVPCVIGNVDDAYLMLKKKLQTIKLSNFEEVCEVIFEIIQDYFGDFSNIDTRMNYYPDEDAILDNNLPIGKVSNLKGKNGAMCIERAMLSQNLLKKCGFNSYFKVSSISLNEKLEVHAFNLIANMDKYYIFDSTIPTVKDNKITPLIALIPKEVFDKISSQENSVGYSVEVSHYNPLRNKDITIIYDFGREEKYEIDSLNESKKR